MVRKPRPPREIARSTDVAREVVESQPVVRRRDARQPDLFATEFMRPCKPTLVAEAPVGDRWQYEIKHDGYRMQLHVNGGHVRAFTKSGLEWADRVPKIRRAMEALQVDSAVIDGEAVMIGEDGVSDFFAIHKALAGGSAPAAFLYAFDLLHLNGEDLRGLPLTEPLARLLELLPPASSALVYSEEMHGDGAELHQAACRMGLEGIVAKRSDSRYRSGDSKSWLKVKCTKTDVFGVVAYQADRRGVVRSLELVELVDGELKPAGSVGSGLTDELARSIRTRLDRGEQVVVKVEYRGRTPSGGLRHPALMA